MTTKLDAALTACKQCEHAVRDLKVGGKAFAFQGEACIFPKFDVTCPSFQKKKREKNKKTTTTTPANNIAFIRVLKVLLVLACFLVVNRTHGRR